MQLETRNDTVAYVASFKESPRGNDAEIQKVQRMIAYVTQMTTEAVAETDLKRDHVEWVIGQVNAGYGRARVVNAPLFEEKGVPDFFSREAILKSIFTGPDRLTRKEVVFMMKQGRSPFTLQVKAVDSSANRLSLAEKLINGQPKKMAYEKKVENEDLGIDWNVTQKDLKTDAAVIEHMSKERGDLESRIVWKWNFYQSEPIVGIESWDDITLPVEGRLASYKKEWENAGMRGTDLSSWATAMAAGLECGTPLDIEFIKNPRDTRQLQHWSRTILDEEGALEEKLEEELEEESEEEKMLRNGRKYSLATGSFAPWFRHPFLDLCYAGRRCDSACFRASREGVILAA